MTKVRNCLLFNRQVEQARDFELKSLFEHLYYIQYKVKLIFNGIVCLKFSKTYSNIPIKAKVNSYDNTNVFTHRVSILYLSTFAIIFYPRVTRTLSIIRITYYVIVSREK